MPSLLENGSLALQKARRSKRHLCITALLFFLLIFPWIEQTESHLAWILCAKEQWLWQRQAQRERGMTGEIRKASVQLNWKTFIKFIYPVFLKQIPRSIDKDTNFNCSYINFNIGRLNSACLLESFSGCYFTFF